MKLTSYALIALVILATSAPTISLAQYENQGGGDEGSTMTILTIFSLTFYITIAAIIGVVVYSVWRVYKIRRNSIKKLA